MIRSKKSISRKKRRHLFAEPLEARRVLAASVGWDGPGLGSAELTYTISNHPSSLSQAEVDAAISTAFAAWSSVVDVSFTKTAQTGLRDSIDISFVSLDGSGGTLAQAYFPDDVNPARIAGDIQFDLSEVWEVGNDLGNRAFDLTWVAVHEIGHALGLDHSGEVGSILQAFVSPSQSFSALDASDIEEIQTLYAAADGVSSPTGQVDPTTTPTTPTTPTTTNTPDVPTDQGEPTGGDTDQPQRRRRNHFFGNGFHWRSRLDADVSEFHNLYNPTDTNNDGNTSLIDALVVINRLGQVAQSGVGLCDVNSDGEVSAIDALMIINTLGESEQSVQPVDTTESESADDSTDPAIDDTPSEELPADDLGTGTDDTGTSNTDDTGTDDTDTDTSDTDETNDEETEIDDGGVLDDENGDCDHGHHHGGAVFFPAGFLRDQGEKLFTRFDEDESGSLTQQEVPAPIWDRLVEENVDADGDGEITREEVQLFVDQQISDRFSQKDGNADGLLTEDEVSSRFWEKISAADTNQDLGVSLEELQAWTAQRAADRVAEQTQGGEIRFHHRMVDRVFAQIGTRMRFARR